MSEWEGVSEWGLSYGDLFEGWEIAVAKKVVAQFQAKHPWLREPGFEDLLQECLTHWYFNRGSFREGRGVSIKSYMANVLSHKLQSLLRKQLSNKRKVDHMAKSLDKPIGEGEVTLGDAIPADEPRTDILTRLEIESAISGLTSLQKRICRLLQQGYVITEIAQELGKPRSTVRDEIRRIREAFSRKGLKDYWG